VSSAASSLRSVWRPYARRSKSLEVLIPILYLKGVSTGDFEEALIALLGKDAGGLSASTIARLKDAWSDEHARWSKRDLAAKRYVYFWVDGIHVQARLEDDAQCLLVIIGATPEGKKELVGLIDGVRESAHSWKEFLLDLKRRGLAMAPELAVADGALGFWQAVEEVWPKTRVFSASIFSPRSSTAMAHMMNELTSTICGKDAYLEGSGRGASVIARKVAGFLHRQQSFAMSPSEVGRSP